MSRKVLLVDADVDALGALASALRARGLTVYNASDEFEAVKQAFRNRPDCVLVDKRLDGEGDLTAAFRAVPELTDTPLLYLVADSASETEVDDVARLDLDRVATRVISTVPRDSKGPADELRGNLEQMPLADLLQMLSMNRRSGVLAISTDAGQGELRLSDGDVADATFRRVEGEKALYRLLGEREGRFAFSPGDPPARRRITAKTSMLLMEAMRQVDEVTRRRRELAPNGEALLIEDEPPNVTMQSVRAPPLPGAMASTVRELTQLLQVPRTVDELLDDIDAPDLTVLEGLVTLAAAGKIRLVPMTDVTAPFAAPEQLPVLRSLVQRLARAGFAPPPRLVLAAVAPRMPALAHAVRRIGDAVAPTELPPRASVPRTLGTLRLGDGVELALVGLPTDPRFSPTWALAIAGASAVVRLHEAGGPLLEAHCDALEVALIDAESLTGSLDAAVPAQIAALVRSALEMAAGV